MKSDWRSYPDNIGHYLSDGCFRCHDGQHVSRDGKAISNDCSLCHDIIEQGPREALESNVSGLVFRHPVDFGTPVSELIVLVVLLSSDPKVMGTRVNSPLLRWLGWTTAAVMTAAIVAMIATWRA